MTLAAAPALNTDNHVAFLQDAEIDGGFDAPFQTAVDIFLPICFFKVGLLLGKEERVDAAVEMGIL